MSKKYDSQENEARKAIAALPNDGLAAILCDEFDRRRLNAEGNPIPGREGLYEAVTTSMLALLGLEPVEGMASKLAAVGNGALLYSKDQDTAGEIRWLLTWVEAYRSASNNPDPELLAKTLAKRYGREVDAAAIDRALRHESVNRRVTEVALAAGVIDSDNPMSSDYWRKPHNRVRDFLKRK